MSQWLNNWQTAIGNDMHGNVAEWCADHRHPTYEGAPTDGSAWLSEDESSSRIRRGGSWMERLAYCRSASRHNAPPTALAHNIGFRVVCSLPQPLPHE